MAQSFPDSPTLARGVSYDFKKRVTLVNEDFLELRIEPHSTYSREKAKCDNK
jgi:hypothetical protein